MFPQCSPSAWGLAPSRACNALLTSRTRLSYCYVTPTSQHYPNDVSARTRPPHPHSGSPPQLGGQNLYLHLPLQHPEGGTCQAARAPTPDKEVGALASPFWPV